MDDLVLRITWDRASPDVESLVAREWLATNGLGGYSSGSVAGIMTRKYHGYLVAALPAPHGRIVMLQNLTAALHFADGRVVLLDGEQRAGRPPGVPGASHLREFRLELGLPVWEFEVGGARIERRLLMPHGQNTTFVYHRLLDGPDGVDLSLRPAVHFRAYEAAVTTPHAAPYRLSVVDDRFEVTGASTSDPGPAADLPPLRLTLCGTQGTFTLDGVWIAEAFYAMEEYRGYESVGQVWSPGYYRAPLERGRPVVLAASTESWDAMRALAPDEAIAAERERRHRLLALPHLPVRDPVEAQLVLAADQFIISPAGRAEEAARARAQGDAVRTVIAGYHWFTDWGRDTMISLDGLALATGRHREAAYILRTFAHYVRDGLIPNMFPDGSNEGLYHTADATLWFFHALHRYVAATGDRDTLRHILPRLAAVADAHLRGTRFGIGVDPADGLLRQGAEGYQLTWMDAKVDGWVVTPRRGKAVEINALWYNALCLLARWLRLEGEEEATGRFEAHAARARESFNRRFWYDEGGYLYDVVDGEGGKDDPACRPNQVFAISLEHPVLDRARWPSVLDVVRARLLTPYGLRSLAPGDPSYKARYFGDLRTRDAAYHQGTVWGWLIGPFVDAWLKAHPADRLGARRLLDGLAEHLRDFGVGSIAEIFDAESPFAPRGCIAQAWSVAEVLRCWVATRPDAPPPAASLTTHDAAGDARARAP